MQKLAVHEQQQYYDLPNTYTDTIIHLSKIIIFRSDSVKFSLFEKGTKFEKIFHLKLTYFVPFSKSLSFKLNYF